MKNRPKIPFEATFWADMCPNRETWIQREIWRIPPAYLVTIRGKNGVWGGPRGSRNPIMSEKGRNMQWKYCSRDEYVSEWINVDPKKLKRHTVIIFRDKKCYWPFLGSILRIFLAYLVIQGFQKSFIGPKQGGKIDFFYKMTANTFIWYFFMSVYESKSINVDSRRHLRSTTNCSKNVGASKMHFQVKKGSKYTFMQKNGKKLLTHANLYVFKLCNLYV